MACEKRDDRVDQRIRNGKVAERGKVVEATSPRRDSQGSSEGMRTVERTVWKIDSVPYELRTRSSDVGIKFFADCQSGGSRGIGNGGVANSEKV